MKKRSAHRSLKQKYATKSEKIILAGFMKSCLQEKNYLLFSSPLQTNKLNVLKNFHIINYILFKIKLCILFKKKNIYSNIFQRKL